METVSIKILDTNLENNLLSFSINEERILCLDKSLSSTTQELINNLFVVAIKSLLDDEGDDYEILNLESFGNDYINYDTILNVVYNIQYIKKDLPPVINYEIEL